MNKISTEHLARQAHIYIRQSTPYQVKHNVESKRRQYGLADRAQQLGWSEVTIIDEDQGHSGSGTLRSGFEQLLVNVCSGNVGAVFCIEGSRLARNGREWHTLLDFCALVNTLLIDEEGIYDPRLPNDRLLLGMKGTIAEMELSTLRQRAQGALDEKAKRGELHTTVATGYVRTGSNRLEKDPDLRIRDAIALVFRKFRELGSIRQVMIWIRQEHIELPVIINGENERKIIWQVPVYNTLRHILTNPVYAGTYVHGRSKTVARIENGRKRLIRQRVRAQQDWKVLLVQHHEGYISWDEYQSNQAMIAQNANRKGSLVQGAVKQGKALLSGLLRCGRCGRRLQAGYSGTRSNVIHYDCRGAGQGDGWCLSFGGLRVDERVSEEVLCCLEPLGIEASLKAIEQECAASHGRIHQKELALQQASYEVAHARRQYDAVDPDNRLVAAELERRWNETLKKETLLQQELRQLREAPSDQLSTTGKEELLRLGMDLPRLWNHPLSSPEIKKRILRTVLKEIVVNVSGGDTIHLVLHWQGGSHTELRIAKNRPGHHRWTTDADTVELVQHLARVLPDESIAAVLNRLHKRTAHGHPWTAGRVCAFRSDHAIPVYRKGEREARGELTLEEAAAALNVSRMTVLRMIRSKLLPATKACIGAPWLIRKEDLQLRQEQLKNVPRTADPNQLDMYLE